MAKKILCRDNFGNKFLVNEKKVLFRPSVYGVILRGKKVLLSKQWDGYDLPGGGIDIGESIESALKREIWEETGFRVEVGKILSVHESFYRFFDKDKHGGRYSHCIMIYYRCRIVGGKMSIKNFDDSEKGYADFPEWIPAAELGKKKICNSLGKKKIIGIIRSAL